jgi:hypothetical protein
LFILALHSLLAANNLLAAKNLIAGRQSGENQEREQSSLASSAAWQS